MHILEDSRAKEKFQTTLEILSAEAIGHADCNLSIIYNSSLALK